MGRLLALATNTFREAIRDRIWISILVFALASILFSVALKEITIGDQAKVVRSIAQGGVDFFSSVIAMFLGISIVWKELEKKTIYTILSKPIPRWMFILGKYLGLMMTVCVAVIAMVGIYTLLMFYEQGVPEPIVFVSFGLLLVELMVLTAWATLFSSYSAPTTATVFLLSIFVIGHLADDIWLFGNQSENPAIRQIASTLYWVLPNFEALSIRELSIHEKPIPWSQVGHASLYGIGYSTAVLSFAIVIFQRKDIK